MVKNASHTLAYSLIALQEMNLAYKFPVMFWNCACLISDSGGAESDDEEQTDEENMYVAIVTADEVLYSGYDSWSVSTITYLKFDATLSLSSYFQEVF